MKKQINMLLKKRIIIALLTAIMGFIMGCDVETPHSNGYIYSDGIPIYYEVFGTGEPILLLHGWSSSILYNWNYTGWINKLLPHRKVIAVDIRGHGNSGKPHIKEVYSYKLMARDALKVMDHLKIQKADFLGYSLGAQCGAYLLGHYTGRFNALALLGIGDETDESLAELPAIVQALRADLYRQILPEGLFWRMAADLDPRNDREALALAALQMRPEGYPALLGGPGLARVDIPVVLINGSNDYYSGTVQNLASVIPGAQVVEIPNADHMSIAYDQRFKRKVIEFLTLTD